MSPTAQAPSPLLADVPGLRRFVLSIVRRYYVSARIRGVTDEDLVNTAFLGLCKAARRYNASRAAITTWGQYFIRSEGPRVPSPDQAAALLAGLRGWRARGR